MKRVFTPWSSPWTQQETAGAVFTCLGLAGCVWDVSGSLRVQLTTKAEKEHKNSCHLFFEIEGTSIVSRIRSDVPAPHNTDIYSAREFQSPTRLPPWVLFYPLLPDSWASHTQDILEHPPGGGGWGGGEGINMFGYHGPFLTLKDNPWAPTRKQWELDITATLDSEQLLWALVFYSS